jgi:beta-lactamase class D
MSRVRKSLSSLSSRIEVKRGRALAIAKSVQYMTRHIVCIILCLSVGVMAGSAQSLDLEGRIRAAFAERGITGTLLIETRDGSVVATHNPARVDSAFVPASTFKIPNTLFALDAGIIADSSDIMQWDGVERRLAQWNRDHTLASAFSMSAVWYYQALARQIGPLRMKKYLDELGYGNGSIEGGIDYFWLGGGLRISPREQVALLRRLYERDLPFSREHMDVLIGMMLDHREGDAVIRAKTGWSDSFDPNVGWYVGWLERGSEVVFFALNVDINSWSDAAHRKPLVLEVLRPWLD